MTAPWKISGWLGVLALLVMLAAPAQATIITYPDLASFQLATTGNTLVDFEWLTPGGSEIVVAGAGVPYNPVAGVTITGAGTLYAGRAAADGQTYDWGANGASIISLPSIETLLPANTTAVAVNLGKAFWPDKINSGLTVTLTVGGVDQTPIYVQTFANPQFSFFGVTSDSGPITKMLTAAELLNNYVVYDNLIYGTAIPEPVSGALVLLGALAGLGLRWFRRG